MKKFKRILAMAIAMAMVVAMALPTMAATIKVDDTSATHQYKVYQIFTGTLTEETDPTTGETTKTLADIKYGTNYQAAGKNAGDLVPKAELDAILALTPDKARAYATTLLDGETANGEISGNPVATLSSSNSFTASDLADGYYLIVDDTAQSIAEGDSFSRYIVQVIGDVEIAPKKSTVEEHKNIKEDTHSPSDVTTDKSADDLSIGETVTFVIDATVPLNATDYDKYFFVINDTLSTGLTLDPTSFSVYTKSGNTTTNLTEKTNYTLFVTDPEGTAEENQHTAPDNGKTFQIALLDAKSYAGQTIYVEYTATLNENAAIGEVPNTNTTTVQYSNNPENSYNGDDNNNDGKPDEWKTDVYGESPEQQTKTYTSSIQLKKVKEDGTALQGAEFEITGTSVKTVVITTDVYTEDTEGTFYKLKDGTYTTVEPAETDSYVSKGTGKADGGYVRTGEAPNYTYTVATYDQLNDTTTEIFAKVTATADQYDSTEKKYKKETKAETVVTSESVKAKAFVDANGIVKFDGLGAGTYTIKETTVPDGYNKIDDIEVVITFDKDDADKDAANNDTVDDDALVWKATSTYVVTDTNTTGSINEIDSNGDGTVDTFEIQVVNKQGTVLPSTGGIGTTIFYVVGTILVIGAGVILITRRRMDA